MILFDLKCDLENIFEAWIDYSDSFKSKLKNKLNSCPFCDSNKNFK